MFTGLIEDIGELVSITRHGRSAQLTLRTALPSAEFSIGDSLAVNGACLTLEKIDGAILSCHCLAETLSRTNLGQQQIGAKLNLERALRVGDRMGGHIVTGHVDFTAEVRRAEIVRDDLEIEVTIPDGQEAFFVEKGSVALNGVSLTIASIGSHSFTVCLIPHTAKATNLGFLRNGELLNVESDLIGKYVLRTQNLRQNRDASLLSSLKENGFFS